MPDQVTYLTDFERRVISWLENLGFEVMEQVAMPPYTLDIYVPTYHLAIEIDGPQHRKSADEKRDGVLCDVYGLVVFHIRDEDFANKRAISESAARLLAAWNEARKTLHERVDRVRLRVPWVL